ncbi:carboxypeptidase-like regulatory domain-containing protein [Pontibacter sp. JH31]|uniref:Carboxypeptidase-like regulatory domain-containing protein n=1 Tax=Pontibacter aquaedesilientis TaxID=2766980 RepID=A0ABR7XE85_9BACT|nr:carboxypeptidase-like regulatory domain-containing protein [Pontibacter aquaedesilientis]
MPLVVLAFILLGTTGEVAAQGHKRVVQLTGFVTIGDSLYGVAGVNVYVPKTSRGAQTNAYGFFSVPVLTGDSVVFSAIGYKKQYLKVPKNYQSQSYSIIMQMQEDPTQLPEVQVFPWATERDFRDAVLAVKVPDDGMAIAMRNLDPKRLEELFSVTPMDGNANFRNWNMQNVQRQEQRNMFPTVSPFAIIQLLNMLKNGEFNKK